jgi:hypothetical protein
MNLRAYSKALNADAMKIMHFVFLTNEGAVLLVSGRQWLSLHHCYSQHITQQRNWLKHVT